MLQGYNILEFYTSVDLQRWENLENKESIFTFPTNIIPPFFLVSTTYTATATTVQVFDASTDVAIDIAKTVITSDLTTYMTFKYLGATLTGLDCGNYYLKIVNGTNIFYSEVFAWEDDITDYLKINATSNSLTLGQDYTIDLTGITFTCYVSAEESFDELEVTEEGVEKPYGDIPVFNTLNTSHGFDVFGNRSMLRFLFGLRILETNGAVSFAFGGRTYDAYDILVEKGESIGYDDTNTITIKFKENNYISSKNV